jgi:hypothetical protein
VKAIFFLICVNSLILLNWWKEWNLPWPIIAFLILIAIYFVTEDEKELES